jgi:8-oxo-dGTP pyrophosphatase MutT (NUDIX family)
MTEDRNIVTPALAATILVVRDDPFEVLMVKRRSSSHFSSALVFPGGLVDAADSAPEWANHLRGGAALDDAARAIRVAGFRETFEETGIVIAAGARPKADRDRPFLDVVRNQGVTLDLDAVAPFGHWITPENAPKRFDTHFLLARAPDGAEPVSDNNETVSVEWVNPAEALARAGAGDFSILFPTLMNLRMLAQSMDAASALAAARARKIFTVRPILSKRDGQTVLNIPAEAGYGVTEYVNPPQSTLLGRGEKKS